MLRQLELLQSLNPNITVYVSYDRKLWEKFDPGQPTSNEIYAWIALYSDGQVVDCFDEFEPLPDGAYFIEERKKVDRSDLPKFKDIRLDSEEVMIVHERSPFHIYDASLYQTRITNKGKRAFKINRFSAYNKQLWDKFKARPSHANIIDGWFNQDDFKAWYGQQTEWIQPTDSVCEYRNYGENCFWIYEVQMEDGEISWVAAFKE